MEVNGEMNICTKFQVVTFSLTTTNVKSSRKSQGWPKSLGFILWEPRELDRPIDNAITMAMTKTNKRKKGKRERWKIDLNCYKLVRSPIYLAEQPIRVFSSKLPQSSVQQAQSAWCVRALMQHGYLWYAKDNLCMFTLAFKTLRRPAEETTSSSTRMQSDMKG